MMISIFIAEAGIAQEVADSAQLATFLKGRSYGAMHVSQLPTGHLWTEVAVNGVKGRFILDTGAGATVIESERKDKFKLQVGVDTTQAYVAGSGPGMAAVTSEHNIIQIGTAYAAPSMTLHLLSLDKVNAAMRALGLPQVDGVLGADVLAASHAIIDYSGKIVYMKQ